MLMYKMIFRNPNNYQCITGGELYHHGILGQKWGIRRFQKKDGSLTAAGKKRYSEDESDNIENDKDFLEYFRNEGTDYKKITDPELKELMKMEYLDYKVQKMFKLDKYGNYCYTTKNGIEVRFDQDSDYGEAAIQVINGLTSDNISKMTEEISRMAAKNNWNEDSVSSKDIQNNLRMWGCRITDANPNDSTNSTISIELGFEHKDMMSNSAIFGDHSIDYEGTYNPKTNQFKLIRYSING